MTGMRADVTVQAVAEHAALLSLGTRAAWVSWGDAPGLMIAAAEAFLAEMTLEAQRATGETMRAAMGEVFVFRNGKIAERRAYVVELEENDYK